MRKLEEITNDLVQFYGRICPIGVSTSINEDRSKFIELRNEICVYFPKEPLFIKKLNLEDISKYKHDHMALYCSEMIKIILASMTNTPPEVQK